jgi:hypothetical protein
MRGNLGDKLRKRKEKSDQVLECVNQCNKHSATHENICVVEVSFETTERAHATNLFFHAPETCKP